MNCYRKSKVLVIGHTGFKGSWLVNCLSFFNANIYANQHYYNSRFFKHMIFNLIYKTNYIFYLYYNLLLFKAY